MQKFKNPTEQYIRGFKPPRLVTGKDWYISYYAFDPLSSDLKRIRVRLNHIKSVTQRRAYANDYIKRLTQQLLDGYNPFIESDLGQKLVTFDEACKKYRQTKEQLYAEKIIREETYSSYISYLVNLERYNKQRVKPIYYLYQLDKQYILDFLDYIWLEKKNRTKTRDNYLGWLRLFISYLMEIDYMDNDPTLGLKKITLKHQKLRTVIDETTLNNIKKYLLENNKYFLLASYFLYYCFIRPKELSHLKIKDINIAKQTVFLSADTSKNKNNSYVTLPATLINLMIDLKLFDNPNDYYIFSDCLHPGEKWRDEKQFRDYWNNYIRKNLKLKSEFKFYSLKDTGITNLLRAGVDTLTVRDQARHYSLEMTDIYTPHNLHESNPVLKNFESSF